MSLAILEQATVYAPLNTTIDGDRDYRDLTGLGRCNCGYQGLDSYHRIGGELERIDSEDILGFTAIAAGAYGGYKLAEGRGGGVRAVATLGGAAAGLVAAIFLAFR